MQLLCGLGRVCVTCIAHTNVLSSVSAPRCVLQRFWAGSAEEYRFMPAHEIASTFYATKPGAAIIEELNEPAPTISTGQPELATHK